MTAKRNGTRDGAHERPPAAERFRAAAREAPDAVAVRHAGASTRYRELLAWAEASALAVRAAGLATGAVVPVELPPGPDLVAEVLGVLLAGGAPLLLDPALPEESRLALRGLARASLPAEEGATAACLLTAGSRGPPRAVLLDSQALSLRLAALEDLVGLVPSDRVGVLLPLSAPEALFDLLLPLVRGATLCLPSPEEAAEPHRFLARERISVLRTLPSVAGAWLAGTSGDPLAGLRRLVLTGEPLPEPLAARLRGELEPGVAVHVYELAETGPVCAAPLDGPGTGAPSLGRPLAGCSVVVVSPRGIPCGVGEPGELAVRTPYAGRLLDPGGGPPPAAGGAVQTGDRGWLLPDGAYQLLGRVGAPLRIRGNRVDAAAVESALLGLAGVLEAAVVPRTDAAGAACLVGFVSVAAGAPDAQELRRRLAAPGALPEEAVPSAIVVLPRLPRLPSGRPDRSALPEAPAAVEPPRRELDPTMRRIAGLFGELLAAGAVGPEADFFSLGGQSLLVAVLCSRLRDELGVELPVRVVFEDPTVAGIAAAVDAALALRGSAAPDGPPAGSAGGGATPGAGRDRLPFLPGQDLIWILESLVPGTSAHHIRRSCRLVGPVDPAAFARGAQALAERHEALRTTVTLAGGMPFQRVHPQLELEHRVDDLSALSRVEREARIPRLSEEETTRSFDLLNGPLWRTRLVRLAEQEHVLFVTMHHLVSDARSADLVVDELLVAHQAIAAGREPVLRTPKLQPGDLAIDTRRREAAGAFEPHRSYWREALRDLSPRPELPSDRRRPATPTLAAVRAALDVDAARDLLISAFAREAGCSRFNVGLAALAAFLGRLTESDEVIIGVPVALRDRSELRDVVGCVINTLPIRVDLSGGPDFRDLVARARTALRGGLSHAELPLDRIVADAEPPRRPGRSALFDVLFNAEALAAERELAGLRVIPQWSAVAGVKVDIEWTVSRNDTGVHFALRCAQDMYDAATAERLLGGFASLLDGALAAPDTPVHRLPLVGPGELSRLRGRGVGAKAAPPATLPARVLSQASRTPDAVAVVAGDASLAYRELERRSGLLAARLRARGARRGERVAVLLPRSLDLVPALLAVLRSGAAYVPLDPAYPADRLAFMLADSGARLLLTDGAHCAAIPAAVPVVRTDEAGGAEDLPSPGPSPSPDDLAYVIYTSGSTGTPKGVAIRHAGLASYLTSAASLLRLSAADSCLAVTPVSFDMAALELFAPLVAGGSVVVAAADDARDGLRLRRLLAGVRPSLLHATPSTFRMLLSAGWTGSGDLRLVLAGEALPPALAARLLPSCAELWNFYGPTEITIDCTAHRVTASDLTAATIPIGAPLPGVELHVLDPRGEPVPAGVPGELWVGGVGLAEGYWHGPELTAERFVTGVLADAPTTRLYRTGDRVRWRADGVLEFLGRLDGQVKIRGVRVEPAEVEAALACHPAIQEAVVVPAPSADGSTYLAAYYAGSDPLPPTAELRRFLAQRLPPGLVPSAFVPLARLPLTPAGKVDRRALPAPLESSAQAAQERTPTEEVVAGLWAELLGAGAPPLDQDFFTAGGHSLLAAALGARLHEVFGFEVPLDVLFAAPTIAAQAAWLQRAREDRVAGPALVRVERRERLPLSSSQERMWLFATLSPGTLVQQLRRSYRLAGALDGGSFRRALELVGERHEALRTTFGSADGEPFQQIHAQARGEHRVDDLSSLPEAEREAAVARMSAEQVQRRFDTEHGPLWRTQLVRLSPAEHVLLITLHHLVGDGWSTGVILEDLLWCHAALAAGREPELPALPFHAADAAAWERRRLDAGALAPQRAFWRDMLRGAPPALELPTDRPRRRRTSYAAGRAGRRVPPELVEALRALGRAQGATLFSAVLATLQLLLARLSGEDDIVVGTPVAGRDHPGLRGVVAPLLNTLPLRARIAGERPFRELLAQVGKSVRDALAAAELPFERIVGDSAPPRVPGRNPFFEVVLNFIPPLVPERTHGILVTPQGRAVEACEFELMLRATEGEGGLELRLEYQLERFTEREARTILGQLVQLLADVARDPDRPAGDHSLVLP